MKKVIIYTDGACSGNPGPGGWAAVLQHSGQTKEIWGHDQQTTNNRMEMMAAIEGLRALKEPCQVELFTDSAYLRNAFVQHWLKNWQRNGWRTSSKQPVENQDLWRILLALTAKHQVTWVKVKGHAGDRLNDRADELARSACRGETNKEEHANGSANA